jgi:predicted dehydrogenase
MTKVLLTQPLRWAQSLPLILSLLLVLAGGPFPAAPACGAELGQPEIWSGFPDWVSSVACSPDGKLFAAGSYGTIRLREATPDAAVSDLNTRSGFARSLCFSPDGQLLAVGGYQGIELWDVAQRQRVAQWKGIRGYVTGLIIHGDELISGSEDGVIRRWNLASHELLAELPPLGQPVRGLALSPAGDVLAAACGDETRLTQPGFVSLLQLPAGTELHRLQHHKAPVQTVAFLSPELLLSGGIDEQVLVCNVQQGTQVRSYAGHSRPVNALAVFPGTTLVASGSGGRFKGKNELRIWDASSGAELAVVEPHAQPVSAVAISATNRILVGSRDQSVSVWDAQPLLPAAEAPAESSVTGLPDNLSVPTVIPQFVAFQGEQPLKRIGIIGLDTSHSIAFTKTFNAQPSRTELAGLRVTVAYPHGSADIQSSVSRIPDYTKQIEALGVKVVDSIEALLAEVDYVLLETNDGRPHLAQARQVIAAGKPLFVDKPVTASLADAVALYDLAAKHQVPIFSSSSLRFMAGALKARSGEWGKVVGCDAFSPCSLEPTHPDLFWYGIHGVEILFTVMGPEIETVTRMTSAGTDVVMGQWADGRIGTFRGIRTGKASYGGTVFTEQGIHTLEGYTGYDPLVLAIGEFFRTGKPPVSAEETLALYAFMEAADESKRLGGAPVKVADALNRARAAAR